uniref:CCHC-type domain-containing protein n=1 Tax=Tanacetum cinerariifolium TaxID=118510 RepID=A0A6L2KBM7_TANCI|nr:hypothetical protein [Tanacetum cinerariifolium]
MAGLTRWIEKMELVFQISGCAIENQGEIKKLEIKLWNLKVKGNDVPAYIERFQELTLICTKFVANETDKIDKYVSILSDNIYGSVKDSKPKTLDETIEVYNMGTGKKKPSSRNLPKCTKCHFHHNGPWMCHKCNMVGHFSCDCRSSGNDNIENAQRNNEVNPKGNGCFECEAPRHFRRDYPKLKNKDKGNANAQGCVYAVGNAERKGNALRDPESNVVTGTFLLNNRYASILFDTSAERSFISTAFSSLIDIVPTLLGNSYDVELADGKIVGVDTVMRGCTLNFLNHPFNIDLMPVELGSFDVIIGMDWLRRCHAMTVCDEKLDKKEHEEHLKAILELLKKEKLYEGSKEFVVYCDASHKGLEQVDWRDETDDEHEDKELKAYYMCKAKIQEVIPDIADNSGLIFDIEPLLKVYNSDDDYNVFANARQHPEQLESVNDTYLVEQSDTNITLDSSDMSNNGEDADQDDQIL